MGNIFFELYNQPKSRQKKLRVISMTLMLIVMATSAVSAGGTNLWTEPGFTIQKPAQSRAAYSPPVSPILNVASGRRAGPNDTVGNFKNITGISIDKYTNGEDADTKPGVLVSAGTLITWTYVVSNSGSEVINDIIVTDDNGTPEDPDDFTEVCTINKLTNQQTATCTHTGTAGVGPYGNIASATGTPASGPDVSAQDPSHYLGTIDEPGIYLNKLTNGYDADSPTGPYLYVGETVTWTYDVYNIGNAQLTSVVVVDDNGTPGNTDDDIEICRNSALMEGEYWVCTYNGTAEIGQYANLGTVTTLPSGGLDDVSDSDPSHYFGTGAAIMIEKHTNGQDADTAPGPYIPVGEAVTWEYIVSNDGNLPLSSVSVTDDQGMSVSCPKSNLTVGEQMTCSASGTAVAGQYVNIGYASGTPSGGFVDVSDSDPSNYFGVSDPPQPALALQKYTYGLDADTAPGPSVPVGVSVTWTYTVTNTGNLTLFDVTVTDDNGTPGVLSDDFTVCTIPSLNPDVSDTCSASGTATGGQYTNLGTVSGTHPGGSSDVTDTDPSNYFGVSDPPQPALALQKYTFGLDADTAPGPSVPVGDTVTWTYTFTNTGNLTLFDVTVTDDNGTPSVLSDDITVCTIAFLNPDASDTCSDSGTTSAGQYTNVGTATGTPAGGFADVSASDPSHYFGVSDPPQPALALQKYTNGLDADTAPGPYVPVGDTVTWTYTVTNTGNLTLFDIIVTDDNGTPGDPSDDVTACTIPSLNPDASDTCSANGTAAAGQYANLGTVTGTPPGGLAGVSDTDPSHYFGAQPVIAVEKLTNGQDADTAPGPSILVGGSVTWEYIVSNNGNVPLINIKVIDDQLGSICTLDTLDAGESKTCTATGTAVLGQYANVANVTATPPGGLTEVQSEDSSHYYGFKPESEFIIQKSTNGFDADSTPGPTLIVGYNVSWEFTISNPGDETITNITIIDDNGSPDDESDDLTVCTLDSLAPLDSHTCTIHGKVQHGQYANVGTVTGYLNEKMVSASDPSHYLGKFPILYLPIIFRNATYP